MINRPNLAPTLTMSFLPTPFHWGVRRGRRIELLAPPHGNRGFDSEFITWLLTKAKSNIGVNGKIP